MKRIIALGLLVSSCALFTPQNVNTALTASQIACIFATALTDAPEVAKVCGIADNMIPLVRNLVGQREGAKKAGVSWPGPSSDAGSQ